MRNALLLATSGDLLATRIPAQVKPTDVQVGLALTAGPGRIDASSSWQQALVTAAHLAAHRGCIERKSLTASLQTVHTTRQPDPGSVVSGNLDGNAAAIGATAAGLLPLRFSNPAVAARQAVAAITSHPGAGDGAAAFATAIMLAAQGFPVAGSSIGRFLDLVAAGGRSRQLQAVLPVVRILARHQAAPAGAGATLRIGPTVLRTLPAALTAYLLHPGDPKAAIHYAMMMAGSNRAVVAMTGAIAGASCPDFAVPAQWIPSAGLRQRVRDIAASLADLAFADGQTPASTAVATA